MTDEYRRESIGERVTVVEVEQRNLNAWRSEHVRVTERLHDDMLVLIRKLDGRADRQDIAFARLFTGLAILVFLGQLIAPIILASLGL